MDIKITKSDVAWSYLATFFNMATGVITLPLILKMLSPEEVGFNYILLSINSIVALFDMGFSGQFSRYLTYIFSGAQEITKDGIASCYTKDKINEKLLASTIISARKLYFILSLVAFLFLVTLGTIYVYKITLQFSLVKWSVEIWCVFCMSCFFNLYFLYLNSFLQSRGLIKESKRAQVISRLVQIIITFSLLFYGFGLISVVLANFIAPFIYRYLTYKSFYTKEIQDVLSKYKISISEIKRILTILLHNAKKMAIISILSSALGYASTLVVGAYLELKEVASYGLLVQIVGIILGVATIYFSANTPVIASGMVTNETKTIRKVFGFSVFVFICTCIVGFIGLMLCIPIFDYFEFNTQMPPFLIIVLYFSYKVWETIQSIYSQLLLLNNDFCFFPSAIVTGICSFSLMWFSLMLDFGLIGVVLSQSVSLYAYSAWKWPIYSTKRYNINTVNDIFSNPFIRIKKYIHERCLSKKG